MFKNFIYLFLERGEQREGNSNVWLPLLHPLLGTWPATQARALTGNRTSKPMVCRPELNPLSHTSQGISIYIYNVPIAVVKCIYFTGGLSSDIQNLTGWQRRTHPPYPVLKSEQLFSIFQHFFKGINRTEKSV